MLYWFAITGHCLRCFTYVFHWFFLLVHGFYFFTSLTDPSYCVWFVLFHFILQWLLLTGHGLYCFTSCLTGSSLMGMVYIVYLPPLIHSFWVWFVFFHFPHWFIICIASLHASVALTFWAWSVLLHFMLHWFFLTGHGLYCFTALISSSLPCMVCFVSLHASLVLPY
jgi:hypothetical protein